MASTITKFISFQIPLEDIVKATNNFANKNIIGRGGFGTAYKGQLTRSGKLMSISARRLDRKHGQGDIDFWTEISVLSGLEHTNIVSFIGFCDEKGEKIIICSYEPNGSLMEHLNSPNLKWTQRLRICIGVARALSYLRYEEGRNYGVIHRNINSYTILLDENFEAKLSGFEVSIKQSGYQANPSLIYEAIHIEGYTDPSVVKTGGVTYQSDVYSFGVVLFEILCGRKAFIQKAVDKSLALLAKLHYEKDTLRDIVHPNLRNQRDGESFHYFSKVAYACLKEERVQRPNIDQVVIELEKALEPVLKLDNLKKNLEHLEHLEISLNVLMLATNNFDGAYCFDSRGYYKLYRAEIDHFNEEIPHPIMKNKAELPKRHNTVVIKRFLLREDEQGELVFYKEIEILTSCKHRNIVTLLGFCVEGSEMILVIGNASNRYLYEYLDNIINTPILSWTRRLKICLDVAHGLRYLHSEMEGQNKIINRDVKSPNIVLDENWGASIADFGFSVFLPPGQDDKALYLDVIGGTPSYMDPEYRKTGKLKRESDVYNFGVVMFEIFCGRVAYNQIYLKDGEGGLAVLARRCFQKGTLKDMIDPKIKEETSENNSVVNRGPDEYCLETYLRIAYKCVAETQDQRPTMKVVVQELEKALSLQENPVQRQDVDLVVDEMKKASELHFTHEIVGVQGRNMDQDVDELGKTLELQLTHENPIEEESRNEIESTSWYTRKKKILEQLEHLKISLDDIKLATDNFSEACYIKSGGYYDLYRAKLDHFDTESPYSIEVRNKGEQPKRHNTVVIKRVRPRDAGKGEEVFFMEIEILNSCKHRNIVTLLGFYVEGSEMILVIENAFNGYLDDYLNNIKEMPILNWRIRLKICLDVANGLKYLHSEMEDQKRIINRDIKSENIAFDENWGAKIADVGLSKYLPLGQDDEALYLNEGAGTPTYWDPEYKRTGKLKRESDVYGFGVVLFEIFCGRVAYDSIYMKDGEEGLAKVVRQCFQKEKLKEMIDPLLKEESGDNNFVLNRGPNKDSMDTFLKIACECVAESQDQRPLMRVVVKELEKALSFQEKSINDGGLKISLEDIKLATQNFHHDKHIGGGGFGNVYKGKLPQGDGFKTIVAKRLDTHHGQGEQHFRNELQILFEYTHENVVSLVGYCDEKDDKIIVYEYEVRGSLERYLSDARLTWTKRLNICIDIATALDFLHGGAGKQAVVIHRDIKAPNILLNHDWKAKLADFGLSLISPINQETDYIIDHACGTKGYLDPLYQRSGFLTIESDIYSFGVVLFEMLCGKSTFAIHNYKGQYLPAFIKHNFDQGKHDEVVFEAIKEQTKPKSLDTFQRIAFRCLDNDREKRPTAKEVLAQLKMALEFQIES